MRLSDLVLRQTERQNIYKRWQQEYWVTDGTAIWQILINRGSNVLFCWPDGGYEGDEELIRPLDIACWLADKANYTGEIPKP